MAERDEPPGLYVVPIGQEPARSIARELAPIREAGIVAQDPVSVLSDGVAEGVVAGKGPSVARVHLPNIAAQCRGSASLV